MAKTKTKPQAPAAPAARRDSLVTLVLWLAGIVLALQVVRFCYMSWYFVTFPYQLDYGEGGILQIALRFARGEPIYPPLSQGYPYVIASYVPVYYVVCGLLAKITGPSFLGGRLVSFLATLAIGAVCAREVWVRTRHRFAAFAAAATAVTMPIIMIWGTLMRTDVLGLALALAGFHLFGRKRRVVAVILFGLGVLTRWTNIAGIAAAVSGLVLARKWKQAAFWSAVQTALLLALVFGSNWITRGGMFHQLALHTSSSLGKSWTWGQVWLLISQAGAVWPAYFVLGLVGALWCTWRPAHRTLAIYFLGAWAIFFTSGRIGSTFNYLMEPVIVGAVAVGVMWGELARAEEAGLSARVRKVAPLGVALLAAALAVQLVYTNTGGAPKTQAVLGALLAPEGTGVRLSILAQGLLAAAIAAAALGKEGVKTDSGAPTRALVSRAVLALVGALVLQVAYMSTGGRMEYSISLLRPRASGRASAIVLERIRQTPGPVLCEDFGLIEMAGKVTPLEPFEFTQIAHKGAFDPEPVYRDVREGKFPLIITRFDPEQVVNHEPGADWESGRWPDGIVQALRTRYRLAEREEPYLIYVPR
jgi:hypothetical protein